MTIQFYGDISYADKLTSLSEHYKTSVALAQEIKVSRMTLVNWRDNPESISDKNRDRIDYVYCRDILLPTMSEGQSVVDDVPLIDGFFDQPDFRRILIERLSFGSLEIETGTREADFNEVVREGSIPASSNIKSILDINNIFQTTKRVIELFREAPVNIDSGMVRNWHAALMSGVRDDAGFYSKKIRILPDTELRFTEPDDIPDEVEFWAIKTKDPKSMMDVARAHAYFELIHPFGDGNGRVGRLVMLWHCLQAGLMPPLINQSNKALYYATIEHCQLTGIVDPLANFLNYQSQRSVLMLTGKKKPGLTL
jgi:hypothetical protein